MTQVDLWTLENELRTPDTDPLCGVDEAGRGPLAGPVCAAAVMLPPGLEIPGLNDSKKLSENKREAFYDTIIAQALSYGIAFATVEEIEEKFRMARSLGFDNINMDLIAGLPGDTVEGFRHSLQMAIDLDPENITVHTLTLKRASNLVVEHRAADYADVAAMVESCELLEKAGYRPYYLYRQKGTLQNLENVGWCKPGYECLYNIYIMEEVHTILSAGAGGSTKLVAPGARHGKIERIFNYKYPIEYIDRFDTILARKEGVKQFYDQYPSCGESARPQAHGGV